MWGGRTRRLTPRALVRIDYPIPTIPENPAVLSNGQTLWLAYEIFSETAPKDSCAVLVFDHVIEHWLSPINDEGLGTHPYARAGLQFYALHEILESAEADRWSAIGGRHWVVTFKDVTLDVVAEAPRTLVFESEGPPLAALLAAVAASPI